MGNNVVSNTVLISALCTAIVVCVIYFFHAHLIPHLRRQEGGRSDTPLPHATLPQWQVRSDPNLRESLYGAPTPNYLDPRNSVAGSDLPKSRWSTNVHELSRPSSSKSMGAPRSIKSHSRQLSLLDVPMTPNKRLSAPSLYSQSTEQTRKRASKRQSAPTISSATTQRTRKTLNKRQSVPILSSETVQWYHEENRRISRRLEQAKKQQMRRISTVAVVGENIQPPKNRLSARPRSRSDVQAATRRKSDSHIGTKRSVLARSHASFYGRDYIFDPESPMPSTLSGTNSQSDLTTCYTSNNDSQKSLSYFPVTVS